MARFLVDTRSVGVSCVCLSVLPPHAPGMGGGARVACQWTVLCGVQVQDLLLWGATSALPLPPFALQLG